MAKAGSLDNAGLLNKPAVSTVLYDKFKEWCADAGEKPVSQSIWAREIKKLPYVTSGHGAKGTTYHIEMDVDNEDGGDPVFTKNSNLIRLMEKYRSE